METRMSRESYFKLLATTARIRGTCNRLQVGAVLVNDKRLVAMGYNGAPSEWDHCHHEFTGDASDSCKKSIHAELSVLLMCAKEGVSTKDCEMYVTHFPCRECIKAMSQAGLKACHYIEDYKNAENPYAHYFPIFKLEE